MNKKLQILKGVDAFKSLPENELSNILALGAFKKFKNRGIIIEEGSPADSIYLVLKGRVMVYKITEAGKVKALAILQEGELLGEMAIISPAARSASAKALGPVQILELNGADFRTLLKSSSSVAMSVMSSLCQRLRSADKHIEILFYNSVPKRVLSVLLLLAATSGKKQKLKCKLVLTQKELAEVVGSAREVVNRTLQVLKKDGQIRLKKGSIEIVNYLKLKEYKIH